MCAIDDDDMCVKKPSKPTERVEKDVDVEVDSW